MAVNVNSAIIKIYIAIEIERMCSFRSLFDIDIPLDLRALGSAMVAG
jgi:hypothetical protein